VAEIKNSAAYALLLIGCATQNIQSFVITNQIKGFSIPNMLMMLYMGALLLTPMISENKKILVSFYKFIICFSLLLILQIISNQIFEINNNENLYYISSEINETFRISIITQSLYFVMTVIFFFGIREYGFNNKIIKYTKLGIYITCFYGLYEFVFYLIYGFNGDFISNRITGVEYEYGTFQVINIGSVITSRIKSLSGEPSMYAFAMLPFFVYFYEVKDKIWIIILITLIFTFSTTFYFGIITYILYNIFFKRAYKIFFLSALFIGILYFIFNEFTSSIIENNYQKLIGVDYSGSERILSFINHINAWYESNVIQIIFGHGFGYARSTDFFSTILYNMGLIGLIFTIILFIYPIYKLRRNYLICAPLLIIFVTLLVSVSEPFYYSVWFFLGGAWHELINAKHKKSSAKFANQ
jgi:hypothetical protein